MFHLLLSDFQVRNTFGHSCNITVKTGTDLAKTKESQIMFTAFNSVKIASFQELVVEVTKRERVED